jgi:hypothetical protein
MEVATRLGGFQWHKRTPGGSPFYTPGVFLAVPDDYLSHLHEEAPPQAVWHGHALAKAPECSRSEVCAFRAAEQSSPFRAGRASPDQDAEGNWIVRVPGRKCRPLRLPEVVCSASLAWAGSASATRR